MTQDRTYTLWHVIGQPSGRWTAAPCDLFGMEWEPRRTRVMTTGPNNRYAWAYSIVVPACDRDDPIAMGEAALRREFGDDVPTYTPAKRTETTRSAFGISKMARDTSEQKADALRGAQRVGECGRNTT